MNDDILFEEFRKIPRLNRDIIVTEKIDGTNGVLFIMATDPPRMLVGSKSRWIEPGKTDNHGFAAWAREHEAELIAGLGVGRHHGEWWGSGIQRRYGLTEKRFSLFNTSRFWCDDSEDGGRTVQCPCCHVVPVLYSGKDWQAIPAHIERLREYGSVAAPGFMQPEGVIVYHTAANAYFKATLERDDEYKGKQR